MSSWSRYMKILYCILAALLMIPALWAHAREVGSAHLSSLTDGCRLELRTSGKQPMLWLVCRNCRFALLGRESLEGQVTLQTEDQALEFVRLFSTPDTWY